MKRKILIFVMMLTFSALFTIQSCDEDATSFTEYGSFTDPVVIAPNDGGFVTLAGTTVDLKWESTDSDGDSQNWDVYFGESSNPGLIESGYTQQSITVTVEKGVEYFWNVIGRDSHNVLTRSPTWSFIVVDPDADMVLGMSWDTDILSAIGLDLDPDEVVDLRLLIIDDSDKSIVGEEDGGSFEEYVDFNTLPDGTYLVATDIYSTVNAGDFNAPINLDIELAFNQLGTVDLILSFAKVMTNEYACDAYRTYLAKVTKVGTEYTIVKDVSYLAPESIAWYGTDADYPSEVATVAGCDLLMSNLGAGWMFDFWGEIVTSGGTFKYTVDGSGNITIPLQNYITTTYLGADQPSYFITGSGTLDESGAFPVMYIKYDYIQAGTSIGELCEFYGLWPTPYFEANLTLDPAGKKGASKSVMTPDNSKVKEVKSNR